MKRHSRKRARTVLLACASLAAALLAGPGAGARTICVPDDHPGGEWRMMNHDYAATRHQSEERVLGRLNAPLLAPAWTFDANAATGMLGNEITGYPIVADGCVFFGSSTGFRAPGWVFALNADGGDLAWKTRLPYGVYSTAAVANGIVYFFMSNVGAPSVVALDEASGRVLWTTVVDYQPGSDAVSSPIVYDGMVWVGVSGTAAEGTEEDRFDFRGSSVLLDAATGDIIHHEWSIPDEEWRDGQGDAGAAIWSTISVDTATGFGYVGSGNPFNYEHENAHANAILKIDLRKTLPQGSANPDLGKIVASYKGNTEKYFGELGNPQECRRQSLPFAGGFECGNLDLDFGAAPNIFQDRTGRTWVGEGQKSGVYHVVDPGTMKLQWQQIVGVPSLVGGIVGTPAFDGTALYVPQSVPGYLTALDRDTGEHQWVAPTADAVHWGNPVTVANGVVYTVDLKGFLDAYDAGTGASLLHRPMELGANTGVYPTFSWGGVTVARNTVYASIGVGITSAGAMFPQMPDGFVIAFRPAKVL